MRLSLLSAVMILATAIDSGVASGREWTDRTGEHTVQGELIASDEVKVCLRKANGRLILVAIEQFSDADREFITLQREKQRGPQEPAVDEKRRTDGGKIWRTQSGEEFDATVAGFDVRTLFVCRRLGKLYIGPTANILVPYEKLSEDAKSDWGRVLKRYGIENLTDWAKQLGPEPQRFDYPVVYLRGRKDGVVSALKIGALILPDALELSAPFKQWLETRQKEIAATEKKKEIAAAAREKEFPAAAREKDLFAAYQCPACKMMGSPVSRPALDSVTEGVDEYICPNGHHFWVKLMMP